MRRTDDTLSSKGLSELFSIEEGDDPLRDVEATHDGEWRREGDLYRFFIYPEAED